MNCDRYSLDRLSSDKVGVQDPQIYPTSKPGESAVIGGALSVWGAKMDQRWDEGYVTADRPIVESVLGALKHIY